MAMTCGKVLLATVLGLFLSAAIVEGELTVGFYEMMLCPAEAIVKEEVTKAWMNNKTIAAALLRLHFHDCFVRGCEASVLLNSTQDNVAEKDARPNLTLRGFDIIDTIKQRLEILPTCVGKVSCADILTFAARDSVVLAGGTSWPVAAGRKDGNVSRANETSALPSPRLNLDGLTANFAAKGLSQDDLITLSGAHTIGHAHCGSFSYRLYNYSATMTEDPKLDSNYADELKESCPVGNLSPEVPMDPQTPDDFDTKYYSDVLARKGLFESDAALISTPSTRDKVQQNAGDASTFKSNFTESMIRMGAIGVLTGDDGEVRVNCGKVNPSS